MYVCENIGNVKPPPPLPQKFLCFIVTNSLSNGMYLVMYVHVHIYI